MFYYFTISVTLFHHQRFYGSTNLPLDVLLFENQMLNCSTMTVSLFHHQMFYCSTISVPMFHDQILHCSTIRRFTVLPLDVPLYHHDCPTFPPSHVLEFHHTMFHHLCSTIPPSLFHCSTITCSTVPP